MLRAVWLRHAADFSTLWQWQAKGMTSPVERRRLNFCVDGDMKKAQCRSLLRSAFQLPAVLAILLYSFSVLVFSKWAYWHVQFEVISKCLPKVSLKPIKRTIWSVSKICIHLAKEIMIPDLYIQSKITRLLQFLISRACTKLKKLLPNHGSVRLQKYFK